MASSNPTQPRPSPLADDTDGPWDRESAEALTRAYEESEAEWRESRAARRPPNERGQPSPADPPGSAGAWLESRVADIAERLQRSIAGIDPEKSAQALGQRIDELESRLAAAFHDIAQRLDGRSLESIEAQIGGLTAHLEDTRSKLVRLDAIDDRLRDLAGRLDEHQRLPEPARLDDSAIQTLIEAAADRAAVRVAQSMPPAAPGIDPQRLDALEQLMQDQITERQRAEEMTSSVLRTIEEALGRILDKVDAMEPAGPASFPYGGEMPEPHAVKPATDPLLEAYAQGARALGQAAPASLLDAADYDSNAPRAAVPAPERWGISGWDDHAVDNAPAQQALPASAVRAQPKAQPLSPSMAGPVDTADVDEAADTTTNARARVKPFAATSGRRSSLLLTLAMALLCGASYLAVDYVLAQPPIPTPHERTAARHAFPFLILATPVAVSEEEAATFRGEPLAPHDGARLSHMPGMPPDAVGASGLKQAAADGDTLAQFELASRFAEGRGVARDETQAFAWFQRAAMHGFVPAQFRLAGLLERGAGVTMDAERAKAWYRRAAEQGHVKAMHNLAVLSAKKDGNRADYDTAARWFQEAGERGLTDSQYNIALLYQKGLGVTKSLPEAYKWFALAARGGDKEAAVRLERIKAQLAPGELLAAEQQLAHWRVRTPAGGASPKPVTPMGDDADVGG